MDRKELARSCFQEGYNCAQAVVTAFADEIGLDRETLSKMSVGLGGGVGRMREVCGTVSGMAMVLGLIYGTDDPDSKNSVYPIVQEACEKFREQNGSIVCRELLAGVPVSSGSTAESRTAEFYKKRPCAELVENAVQIVEEILREKDR